uniref:Uncharacterized protein n=1 Tax=Amphiprion percula TaxID=161767 RepID=A0A3P8SED5_AMPPE
TTNAAASDCSLWRGRPRSVGTSSHPDNSDNSVKRGRGRPKGSKKVVSNDGTPRKRGRPKLNKTVGKSGEDLEAARRASQEAETTSRVKGAAPRVRSTKIKPQAIRRLTAHSQKQRASRRRSECKAKRRW